MMVELLRGRWNVNSPASPHKLLDAYIERVSDGGRPYHDSALLAQEPDIEPLS
jgi:hypothetical protein